MRLNPGQQRAYCEITDWLNDPSPNAKYFYVKGHAGTGKEQPLTAYIQTPNGPTMMGHLSVGDKVFGSDGKATTVTAIYPQGKKQAYRVTFRDNTSTECGIDHLWAVYTSRGNLKTKSLKEIIKQGLYTPSGGMKHKVPLTSPVNYSVKKYKIHPYVIGALIGDGALTKQICMSLPPNKIFILNKVLKNLPDFMSVTSRQGSGCLNHNFVDKSHRSNWLKNQIKELGLNIKSPTRQIPNIYMYGSISQRTNLLHGLMDTDGTTRKGRTNYSTMSPRLALNIQTIVQSLGGTAIVRKPSKRDGEISVNIKTMFCPFSGGYKKKNWTAPYKNPPSRYIKTIEKTEIVEQQCISVKAKNNLYLTDNYIVTHNTFLISQIAQNVLGLVKKTSGVSLIDVNVTATTNQAAAVMKASINLPDVDVRTIYSLLNLKVTENYSTGETYCSPTKTWFVHSQKLIIIDEAPMASGELLRFLEIGTDKTCKILFVGDDNQLAPVKEEKSLAYNSGYSGTVLTKSVRNKNQPALIALYEQMKQTVVTGVFTRIVEVPGVIDFIESDRLQGLLERDYSTENTDRRVLCYTNKRVVEYNDYIRSVRGYTEPYVTGEIIVNNGACDLGGGTRLYTGQLLKITDVLGTEMDKNIVDGHEFELSSLELTDLTLGTVYNVEVFTDSTVRKDLMQHFYKRKEWVKYFRIRNKYPELRQTAAATTHKAQGSTYSSVIVDLADIGKCTNANQIARMQYVAMSRAKDRVFIRGVLPDRLFE